MARTKKLTLEERLAFELKDKMNTVKFIPEPTYFFSKGDKVSIGNLRDAVVIDVLEGGKLYLIEYSVYKTSTEWIDGKSVKVEKLIETNRHYEDWLSIRPFATAGESLICNEDIHLDFSNRTIESLFGMFYFFGTDMNPDYQRDYCWTEEDKVALIDSIFHNVDIGKFVFVHHDYGAEYLYEILDGKQRIRAILDFYENRFPYKGKYYNDLCSKDRHWFKTKNLSVAEVYNTDKENILKYFLLLNTSGKTMSNSCLDKVKNMLKEYE